MILGIDEVGRGPWAGPLVVGAVVLGAEIAGLTDSKKLTAKKREELSTQIYEHAQAVGLGWVHADEIDEIGLSQALIEATKRAVEKVSVPYHEIIIDGTINFLANTSKGRYVTTIKRADLLIPSVSAASIVAKVARDEFMHQQAHLYPEYGFESHVGYGTAAHRLAIEKYGVTLLHRLSFAPLAKYRGIKTTSSTNGSAQSLTRAFVADQTRAKEGSEVPQSLTSKQIGDKAEDITTLYLRQEGHEILERNWKTKFCEIDIVSSKNDTLYFTEVKYRKNEQAGGGIAAITSKKLKQMTFAAKLYEASSRHAPYDMRLAVATVSGDYVVQQWIVIA